MDSTVFEPLEIDEETARECWQFAQASRDNYDKRGQHDRLRKINQTYEGKIGEWIAYERLKKHFADLTLPDMKIYAKGSKSWKSDLFAEDLEFAVKTCQRSISESWVFQREDKDGFGRDEGIYAVDAIDKIVVFVTLFKPEENENGVKQLSRRGYIRSVTTLYKLRKNDLFDELRKEELREGKDAVYYSALLMLGFRTGVIHPSVNDLIERVQA